MCFDYTLQSEFLHCIMVLVTTKAVAINIQATDYSYSTICYRLAAATGSVYTREKDRRQ